MPVEHAGHIMDEFGVQRWPTALPQEEKWGCLANIAVETFIGQSSFPAAGERESCS